MPPETLNERVAALEAKVEALHAAIFGLDGLQNFKLDMTAQITKLKGDIEGLTWKVAFATGTLLLVGNHFLAWILPKIKL